MRPSRAMILILAAALCACGGGGSVPRHGSSSPDHRHSTSAAPCSFTSDSVSVQASPLIEIRPPGAPQRALTAATTVPCGTILTVGQSGTATITFGTQAACQVQQFSPASQSARLITRSPAPALFTMVGGHLACTFGTSPQRFPICGTGVIYVSGADGPTEGSVSCDADPVFQVAVFAGTMQVTDPSGAVTQVPAGTQLTFDYETSQSQTMPAEFSSADVAAFMTQAGALGLTITPIPQTIVLPAAPVNEMPGDSYQLTATGGGSGNPVTFAVDNSSLKMCSLNTDTNIVTFKVAGQCVIDASQIGNSEYAPAPQAQLAITVQPPPS
jgi:hypothetical protein